VNAVLREGLLDEVQVEPPPEAMDEFDVLDRRQVRVEPAHGLDAAPVHEERADLVRGPAHQPEVRIPRRGHLLREARYSPLAAAMQVLRDRNASV
jgi:hypothetical protein